MELVDPHGTILNAAVTLAISAVHRDIVVVPRIIVVRAIATVGNVMLMLGAKY
jgi:hypothetical protein